MRLVTGWCRSALGPRIRLPARPQATSVSVARRQGQGVGVNVHSRGRGRRARRGQRCERSQPRVRGEDETGEPAEVRAKDLLQPAVLPLPCRERSDAGVAAVNAGGRPVFPRRRAPWLVAAAGGNATWRGVRCGERAGRVALALLAVSCLDLTLPQTEQTGGRGVKGE